MELKFNLGKAVAVCLLLLFTWLAVASWVFTYELAEWMRCSTVVPECMAVVFGLLGLCSSCFAYGERKRC